MFAAKPMPLSELTDNQLIRLAHRLHRRITYGMGYQPYGYDWPTLWATRPGLARACRVVTDEGRRRGL